MNTLKRIFPILIFLLSSIFCVEIYSKTMNLQEYVSALNECKVEIKNAINSISTYPDQLCQQIYSKPFYVLVENKAINVDISWLTNSLHFINTIKDSTKQKEELTKLQNAISGLIEIINSKTFLKDEDFFRYKKRMNRILSSGEFKEKKLFIIKNKFIERIYEKIEQFLFTISKLFFPNLSRPIRGLRNYPGIILSIIFLIGFVIISIRIINNLLLRWSQPLDHTSHRDSFITKVPKIPSIKDIEMSARGDYRLAIRNLFISFLEYIETKGYIYNYQMKTNFECIKDLREKNLLLEEIYYMNRIYEEHWYGKKVCREENFTSFRKLYQDVISRIDNPHIASFVS